MNEREFEDMYSTMVNYHYMDDEHTRQRLLNFGGKKKLCKMLFDGEQIGGVSLGHNTDENAAVTVFLSDDVLVVTGMRFIMLQSRLLGTLVKEMPIQSVCSVEWSGKGNTLHLSGTRSSLNFYVDDSGIDIIKSLVYQIYSK